MTSNDEHVHKPNTDNTLTIDRDKSLRISDLEAEAYSYLIMPSNSNYKHAITCYRHILGFSALSEDEILYYTQKTQETERKRDELLAELGGLRTVRAVGALFDELILLRVLINKGLTRDESGELLDERYYMVQHRFTSLLNSSAKDRLARIQIIFSDVVEYWDTRLITSVQYQIKELVDFLECHDITSHAKFPLFRAEEGTAFEEVCQRINHDPAVQEYIQYCRNFYAETEQLRTALEISHELVHQAELAFIKEDDINAVRYCNNIKELLGKNKSRRISVILRQASKRLEVQTLHSIEPWLEEANSSYEIGDLYHSQRCLQKIFTFDIYIKTKRIKSILARARSLFAKLIQELHATQTNTTRSDISQSIIEQVKIALITIMPLASGHDLDVIAQTIVQHLSSGQRHSNKNILRDGEIEGLLQDAAGKHIAIQEKVISFGDNSQIGDISIRDIVKGNISYININITGRNTSC